MWIGFIATLILALSAAFRPSWPVALIYIVLLLNGFFQSLQFMAYNTIAYADVPRPQMSTATSFYTTFQQMSLTLGIAMSAAVLAASVRALGHDGPRLSDFSVAFLAVAVISLAAPVLSRRLDKSAGAELSGSIARVTSPEERTGAALDQHKASVVGQFSRAAGASWHYALAEWAVDQTFARRLASPATRPPPTT
jgi:sugar phosphate permease